MQGHQGGVSIHAPAWGATQHLSQQPVYTKVSIHAPAWGATSRITETGEQPASFNPRTRVGCDVLKGYKACKQGECFNPRTRVGCDLSLTLAMSDFGKFQSTHPRGVRRRSCCTERYPWPVSIHAPAWGATVRGAVLLSFPAGFNPRTRVGCDHKGLRGWPRPAVFQSTHPRGVRRDRHRQWRVAPWFQSTHPRGVRPRRAWPAHGVKSFQSTHPRGVRHSTATGGSVKASFNPRTRVGCDLGCSIVMTVMLGFQSTHPRGVRRAPGLCRAHPGGFQSTHPRGVRLGWRGLLSGPAICFNPRTRVGCDRPVLRQDQPLRQGFNPRTRVGCDSWTSSRIPTRSSFNPRTRVGCDSPAPARRAGTGTVSIHAPAWGATKVKSNNFTCENVSIHAPAWGAT